MTYQSEDGYNLKYIFFIFKSLPKIIKNYNILQQLTFSSYITLLY